MMLLEIRGQGTHNPLVVGSNPSGPTIFFAWRSFTYYKERAVASTLARARTLHGVWSGTIPEGSTPPSVSDFR